MLHTLTLPPEVSFDRETPQFTDQSVPAGLLRAHQVAAGVWGLLVVNTGTVVFVDEASQERRTVAAGSTQVIAPQSLHHVEPEPHSTFCVRFYK